MRLVDRHLNSGLGPQDAFRAAQRHRNGAVEQPLAHPLKINPGTRKLEEGVFEQLPLDDLGAAIPLGALNQFCNGRHLHLK